MALTVPLREVFSSSRRWRFRPAVVLALAGALSCAGDEAMPPDPPEPARVTVSPGSLELAALGDTARLSAQVHDQYGDLMADAAVTWASGDASVASVDLDGLVESVGNGEAVVVAKAGSAADSAEVTVAQVVSAVTVSPEVLEFSALGDTLRLRAELVDANGYPVEGAVVMWSSGDAAVATVDASGLVRSVGNGEAMVTAAADPVSGTADVTVAQVVSAVNVSPEVLEFSALGDTLRLGAEAVDANGYPVEGSVVAWSSRDASVATVDASGLVRSVGNGEAMVTAAAGSVSGTAEVTVAQVVSAVTVSPATLEFSALGDTLRLGAEAVDANGYPVEGSVVAWSSRDASVATVDASGLVSSVGNGEAMVVAAADSVSGSAEVAVGQVVSAVTVSPATLEFSALGDTLRLRAEAVDANGYPVEGAVVMWASDDGSVAGVDGSGLVRSVGNGEAMVTAAADPVSGTADVTVAQLASAVTVSPATLEFSALGDTLRLGAEAVDANGYPVEGSVVTWSSRDASVATADASGLVSSVGNGEAMVVAAADSVSGTAEVTVAQLASAVTVSPEVLEFSALGDTLRLGAEAVDANGHTIVGAGFTWASGNRFIAAVDSLGRVRSVRNGSAVVTATSGSTSDSATVTVAQVARTVSVSPATARLTVLGGTLRLEARAMDANGNPMASPAFTWASNANSVATVDAAGLVEAVGYGVATVAATLDSVSGSAEIIVEEDLEREALVALYEATNGPNWSWSRNWMTSAPLSQWQGIHVNDEGRVIRLQLQSNNLAGPLPPELANLTHLKFLRLQGNKITGRMRAWLGALRHLEDLDLGRNELLGSIPPELGGLSELRFLGLCDNELTGPIPPELGNLSNLTILSFCANELTGSTPAELAKLSSLTELNLENNELTGPIPPELGNLSNLVWLWIGHNKLRGPIPPELGDLGRLKRLDLESSGVTGSIPRELSNLSSLEWLDLGFNSLTGSIPPELGNLSSLEWLDFEKNPITGPIPPELGNLAKLNTLILAHNKLTGTIPPELGRLTSIEQLVITFNEDLTGAIPPELADPPKLRTLDLRVNDLTGEIPPEFGKAPSLKILVLRGNRISGPIPPEIGDAPLLGTLLFDHNELSGPVPPEIGNMDELRIVDLTGNTEMAGALPTTMTGLKHVAALLTGETGLCAPNDLDFVRWLRTVDRQRVPLCDPPGAYLVQTVQSQSFPVPLVAKEPALLRVFVTATTSTTATIPPVRATFYQDDEEVHTVTIPARSATIPTRVDESSLSLSSNAEIPGSLLEAGLEMVIEIDPDDTVEPGLLVAKRIPARGRASVDVNDMPLLNLTVLPLLWEEDPDSSVLDLTDGMTDGHPLFTDTHTLLPVGEMDVTVHETVWSSTNDIFQLHREVTALRTLEGGAGHWMGIMPNARGAAGVAYALGGWTAVVKPFASVAAHELGHNMSLLHAPCGNPQQVDGRYPYRDGSIGAWGYDAGSGNLVPPGHSDLMAYCSPFWIGGYHFSRALRYRLAVEEPREYRSSPARSLLLWGGADAGGVPFLEPAFVVDAPASLPVSGGEYRLVGRDGGGGELFSLDFDMRTMTHGDGSSSFSFVLPVQHGWDDTLASLTITGPGGSATLSTASDIPMALLRDPRTGRVRGFVRGRDATDLAAGRMTRWSNRGLEAVFSRGIPEPGAWRR